MNDSGGVALPPSHGLLLFIFLFFLPPLFVGAQRRIDPVHPPCRPLRLTRSDFRDSEVKNGRFSDDETNHLGSKLGIMTTDTT